MNNESDSKIQSQVLLKPYIILFSVIYLGFTIFYHVLKNVMGVHLGDSLRIAIMFFSAFGVVVKFIKDNARPPEGSEKTRLIWLSILSSFLISFLKSNVVIFSVGGIRVYNEIASFEILPVVMLIAILLFVAIFNYCMLRLIYGWGARLYFKHVKM